MICRIVSVAAVLSCSVGLALAAQSTGDGAPKAAPADGRFQVASACGWYAIYTCDKSPSVDGPGYTVRTDDYPNFRKGWYCNVGGPFNSKADAQTQARRFGGYVKKAC